jgi:hypothetical protein
MAQLTLDRLTEMNVSVNRKISSYSKPKLLFEEENLLREIGQWNIPEIGHEPVIEAGSIVDELVPTYDKMSFILKDYSEKLNKK